MQNTRMVTLVNLILECGPLNIVISVMYLCPLCNLKTVLEIFLKLYANYHHDTIGKTQEL